MDKIEFVYDTQMLVEGEGIPVDDVRAHLEHTPPGDSLLVAGDDELVRVHFHTNEPWAVMEYLTQFGVIYDVVIENMQRQSEGLKG
ncbi:MAG: kinase to dihydroxyacetone kinase [Oscillospiraceae bacterium]|nr:kinase to dihydroxyacetone kinase [Oscillospiraceae bacterium]